MPSKPGKSRSILLCEQGFLRSRKGKPVHGIELFRLRMIRQLVELGHDVTLLAEQSWREHFEAYLTGAMPRCFYTPPAGRVPITALRGMIRARRARRTYDALILGNPGKGMMPAAHFASALGIADRTLLFAHRVPTSIVLTMLRPMRFDVLGNSQWVASYFKGKVKGSINAYYGLPNASDYAPRKTERDPLAPVDFVLLGKLPHVAKGMDLAIQAFERLPDYMQGRCKLHLLGFSEPPEFPQENIIAHRWMKPAEISSFLRTMDAMLCLSSIETFSQAIVQGMLTGLPIIATPLPVYVEKVDEASGGAGGMIAKTADEIAKAIEKLAEDPSLRESLGSAGRAVALDRYAWDTQRFLDEYLFPDHD